MNRSVVLVDAGYLLAAAATLITQRSDRALIDVDFASMLEEIRREAAEQTGVPVLRVLWFDGAPDARPTAEHQSIATLPDVKVRLGVLVNRAGRLEQKGVDSFLHRDMTNLSRNGAVCDLVLLGGDEDLRRAVDEAQDWGVRVHLWGVEAAAPEFNQARTLIAEADRRWVLDREWISRFVTPRQAVARQPAATPAMFVPEADAALAALRAKLEAGVPEPPAPAVRPARVPTPHQVEVDTLEAVSSDQQRAGDVELDNTSPVGDAHEAGQRYGQRWVERAATGDIAGAVALERPKLPYALDRELLRWADSTFNFDTWDEAIKMALREGARAAIDAAAAVQAEPGAAPAPAK